MLTESPDGGGFPRQCGRAGQLEAIWLAVCALRCGLVHAKSGAADKAGKDMWWTTPEDLRPREPIPFGGNGAGFKPLADWLHARGLKLGIHVMPAFRAGGRGNRPIAARRFMRRRLRTRHRLFVG